MSAKARREFINQMCETYMVNINHLKDLIQSTLESYIRNVTQLCKVNPDCHNYDWCYNCPIGKVIAEIEGFTEELPERIHHIVEYHLNKRVPVVR